VANAIAAVLAVGTSSPITYAAEIELPGQALEVTEQQDRAWRSLPVNLELSQPPILSLEEYPSYATTVKDWLAQTEAVDRAALTQITGVKLNRTETELEIILDTADGKALQVDASKFINEGNTLIADIPNTVLALPDGQTFQAENPAPDIAKISIEQQSPNNIRISVSGDKTLPKTAVVLKTGAFSYSLNPDTEGTEEEIVVTGQGEDSYFVPKASTATGTDTPIMETPFSVQVVPQDVIRDQQGLDLQDALRNVSGVTSSGTLAGRDNFFSIRGFGNQNVGIPILTDGFRFYGSFQGNLEVAHLEQLEVLKGPSSILYGQIDPGGVINRVTKQPLSDPFYEGELQVGNRTLVRSRIDFTGPLTPNKNLLYRLNTLYSHEQSFRDFDTPFQRFFIAPVLTGKIDDRTDIDFTLEYQNDSNPADFGLSKLDKGVAPVPRSRVINNPDDTIASNYLSVGYNFEHRFNENWKLRNGFRYAAYNYNFNVVALPFFVDGPNITRFFGSQEAKENSYSLNTNVVGKFNTGPIQHTLSAGIDLNRTETQNVSAFDTFNPSTINIFRPNYNLVSKPSHSSLPLSNDTAITLNQLGIYLQDQIYLLKNLILVAGLRYDDVSQKTTNVQTLFTDGGESEQNDGAVTPRVGLLYRPIPQLALYANYAQSFTPNTSITASGKVLEPEQGQGFEVGVKSELFDQKLLLTLAYFNIIKDNVAAADPNNPLFFIAVGQQQSQGVELDIVGELLPGWKMIGAYSYINAEVTQDTDPAFIGNQLFGIPKNLASLWTTYEIQKGALQGLGFGVGFNYVGNRFGDLANSYTVGSYLIGNAAIFYRRDRYRFALNFKNISNAYFIQGVTGSNTGINPGDPLTLIGSFSVDF
jgi:iron complex outermembrane receptor protein